MKTPTTRSFWADCTRVLAVLLVISIHLNTGNLIDWSNHTSFSWMSSLIWGSVARISVPLFVMLSGMFLLAKTESLKLFFQKRMKRVVFPWMSWIVVTILIEIFFLNNQRIFTLNVRQIFNQYIRNLFWFMPLVLELYLLTPLLRKFVKKVQIEYIFFASVAWIIGVGIVSIVFGRTTLLALPYIPYVFWYLGYFVFGFAAPRIAWLRKRVWLYGGLWLIGIVWTALGTFKESRYQGSFNEIYFNYLSISVALASCGAFLFLREIGEKWEKKVSLSVKEFIGQVSMLSLAVYLSHTIVLTLLAHSPLRPILLLITVNPLLLVPIYSYIVCLLSLGVIFLARKINAPWLY